MAATHDGPPTAWSTCAIVGGGPAGLVLGLLLARAGVTVTVLEKHADFLRDFRGDTVHPTTLGLLDDLGLFERFDAIPQSHLRQVDLPIAAGEDVRVADFSRLPVQHPYIAMVPQWDLLELLADAAAEEPSFTLLREHAVTGLVRVAGRVAGVEYRCPAGTGRVLADLVVACDGRWSVVRRAAGLRARAFPVGFDVWWYRIPTQRHLGESLLPRAESGRMAIGIPRAGSVQVARIGVKGSDPVVRARGIEAFRAEAAATFPELADDVDAVASLDEVKLLDVRLDRLRRWYAPGVLCIGDAAHAMSPVGGVGINLAVQDAVAAARILAAPLRLGLMRGHGARWHLARVQRRRRFPAAVIQTVQRVLHRRVIMPALGGRAIAPPRPLAALLRRFPGIAVVPALLIGVGPRPERAPGFARRPAIAPGRRDPAHGDDRSTLAASGPAARPAGENRGMSRRKDGRPRTLVQGAAQANAAEPGVRPPNATDRPEAAAVPPQPAE